METPFVIRTSQFAIARAAVFDFAFEAMDGEVLADGHQAAEASGFVGLLDAVDGEPGEISNGE